MPRKNNAFFPFILILILLLAPKTLLQSKAPDYQNGKIYIPVYSSIIYGDQEREFNLAVTIAIRNPDMKNTMMIDSVDYYNHSGKLVKQYLKEPKQLQPLQSIIYTIKESDIEGGIAASCVIHFRALRNTNIPLTESIMIGTKGMQGVSFSSRGVLINEK